MVLLLPQKETLLLRVHPETQAGSWFNCSFLRMYRTTGFSWFLGNLNEKAEKGFVWVELYLINVSCLFKTDKSLSNSVLWIIHGSFLKRCFPCNPVWKGNLAFEGSRREKFQKLFTVLYNFLFPKYQSILPQTRRSWMHAHCDLTVIPCLTYQVWRREWIDRRRWKTRTQKACTAVCKMVTSREEELF